MSDNLKLQIKNWVNQMIEKYPWLTIKVDFNESINRTLVSFYPLSIIKDNEQFNKDTMAFEDTLYSQYGDNAPLFGDEDKLFKVSDKAEIFQVQ